MSVPNFSNMAEELLITYLITEFNLGNNVILNLDALFHILGHSVRLVYWFTSLFS